MKFRYSRNTVAVAALAVVLPLALTACQSGSTVSPAPSPSAAAPTNTGNGLVLDYTAYVKGATQVSGLAVSPDGFDAALVTDFEKVVIYDLDDGQVESEFPVPLGDLPEQGSTEAVTFTGEDEVAVLYPEDSPVRRYSTTGELLGENDLGAVASLWFGAMTAVGAGRKVALITDEEEPRIVTFDLDGGGSDSVPLTGVESDGLITGLSTDLDGDGLWVGTDGGLSYPVDPVTGVAGTPLATPAVGEPSAIELLVNTEQERVIAVADDDDRFNGSEGPILLHLLPD